MNPFDEGYDPRAAEAALSKVAEEGGQDGEGDGEKEKEDDGMNSLSTYAMNLEPLGLQMLSMFSGDAYYGFVARSLPLPGGADNPQSNLSLGGGPAASGSSRGAHTARLAPLSCSASQNKLTICFRGTADLGTLVADFKAFPSAMIDVSEDSAFFRELLMRRQDGYGDGDWAKLSKEEQWKAIMEINQGLDAEMGESPPLDSKALEAALGPIQ